MHDAFEALGEAQDANALAAAEKEASAARRVEEERAAARAAAEKKVVKLRAQLETAERTQGICVEAHKQALRLVWLMEFNNS